MTAAEFVEFVFGARGNQQKPPLSSDESGTGAGRNLQSQHPQTPSGHGSESFHSPEVTNSMGNKPQTPLDIADRSLFSQFLPGIPAGSRRASAAGGQLVARPTCRDSGLVLSVASKRRNPALLSLVRPPRAELRRCQMKGLLSS